MLIIFLRPPLNNNTAIKEGGHDPPHEVKQFPCVQLNSNGVFHI